jgi:hypothetical protein
MEANAMDQMLVIVPKQTTQAIFVNNHFVILLAKILVNASPPMYVIVLLRLGGLEPSAS